MGYFKLEVVCLFIIVNCLLLLYLPLDLLITTKAFLILFSCFTFLIIIVFKYQFWRRIVFYLFIALGIIFYIHSKPLLLIHQVDAVQNFPQKMNAKFTVNEIVHQQNYQTLIITTRLSPEYPEQRIYANWRVNEPVKVGETWQGELRLRAISSRLNQGGFDKQKWYYSHGITAWASIKSAVKIEENLSLRQRLFNHYFEQTQNLSHQGLLMALSFGERAWLEPNVWQVYQQTNTAHLIAISGLHIGLAMFIGVMLGKGIQFLLPTHLIKPQFPLIVGLVLSFIYAGLAGFAIPTLRAFIALLVVSSLKLLRFHYNPWQLFIRVIAVLLLFDPLMVLSSSFWLSVGAVFCLILWYQVFPLSLIEWKGQPIKGMWRWFLGLIHLQIGLFWLFTPIQLFIFNGISLTAFWANLLIVPLFSLLLVPLILFALFTNGALSSWWLANQLIDYFTALLSFFQNYWINISHPIACWVSVMLGGLFILLMYWVYQRKHQPRGVYDYLKPRRFSLKSDRSLSPILYRNICFIALLGVISASIGFALQLLNKPNWQFETLDIGQGLANLLIKDRHAILYDTGAGWKESNMAEIEVIPYLKRQGLQLDWLILSHDDNDHSGGASAVLQAYPEVKLMMSSQQNYGKTDRTFCQQGVEFQWQGLQIKALAPKQIVQRAKNTHSCVLLVDDGSHKLLLTGDADIAEETQFISQLDKIDVLQVGHYGSKTSTSKALLDKTHPRIAIISAGRWNQWHFPHKVVTERLKQYQSAVYNTAILGQISLLFYPDKIELDSARNPYSPWFEQVVGKIPD